jgi:hypothetical protein
MSSLLPINSMRNAALLAADTALVAMVSEWTEMVSEWSGDLLAD